MLAIEELYEQLDDCYVKAVEVNEELKGIISFDMVNSLTFYDTDGDAKESRNIGDYISINNAMREIDAWINELEEEENDFEEED